MRPEPVGIGIIGCGNISTAYLKAAAGFPVLDIRALADLDMDAARRQADAFGKRAVTVEDLLGDPAVEVVLNLTVPQAHVEVGLKALAAGKHVYSEKPLAVSFADGERLVEAGRAAGLRVGCAPDTFLGGAHQTCRALVDAGEIGDAVAGSAAFMCPGHERWHPNPAFYYKRGGGPVLDMAPYYVTALVNLIGPVRRVAAMAATTRATRIIGSEPLRGQEIAVEVPTHVSGVLEFVGGAVVQIAMSFDVPGHRHIPIEIYGAEGTMLVPDPNRFDGDIEVMRTGGEWERRPIAKPFGEGNLRSLGVADIAHAIREDRPHLASGDLALHVLEVMEALGRAAEAGAHVEIATRPGRPAPLGKIAGADRAA